MSLIAVVLRVAEALSNLGGRGCEDESLSNLEGGCCEDGRTGKEKKSAAAVISPISFCDATSDSEIHPIDQIVDPLIKAL